MKTLILALALLPLSLFATEFASEPIQLNGNYVFSGVKTGLVRDTELVPSMNTKRFNELVADKYDCYLRGDFFYCQKFMHGVEMPEDLKSEMVLTWHERFITFIASGFAPTLTNESDILMEWDINDSVRFEGFPASEYHYYLIRSQADVHKISINFADAQRWFVINDEDHIATSVERTVRTNNLKARIYNIDVEFTRESY